MPDPIVLDAITIPSRRRRAPVRMASADEDVMAAAPANVEIGPARPAPVTENEDPALASMLGTPTPRGEPPRALPRADADTVIGEPARAQEPDPADRDVLSLHRPTLGGSAFASPRLAADLDADFDVGNEHGDVDTYPFVRTGYTGTEDTARHDNPTDTRSPTPSGQLVSRRLDASEASVGGPSRVPTASPASPSHDARHQDDARPRNDREILEEAQRGRRGRTAGRAVLGILGGVMSGVGALTNAPGLAMLGGILNAGGHAIDPNVPMQDAEAEIGVNRADAQAARQAAQDAARADEAAFERTQAIRMGKRADRASDINEGNMLTGQENARATRERLDEAEARQANAQAARLDPAHQNARDRAQLFSSRLAAEARRLPTLAEDFADVSGNLEHMNADQIDAALDELKAVASGGGRRGRVGTGARRNRDFSQPLESPAQEALAQEMFARRQGTERPITIEVARDTVGRMTEGGFSGAASSALGGIAPAGSEAAGRQELLETQQIQEVPGWTRTPNAPRLSAAQAERARKAVSAWEQLSTFSQRMERLHREVTVMQRASASRGAMNAKLAEAHQLQEQLSGALRELGNYGVPNGTELQRMEALAPRLDTVDGFLNAGVEYPALRRVMRRKTGIAMRSEYGYTRPGME